MKISKQARRDARELFRTCVVRDALDEARARQAVAAVIRAKPRGYIAILSHFERLIRLELARRTATIESAQALPPEVRDGIQTDLARQYGPGLAFQFKQNPELIGGTRIQVGGDVYNGSIQGRLAALREIA
ncbi:MAG TPA: F0F1 ATP synthase subunit delta [Verrucomicrobiae bacterium]|jgi:F-type H+-transporting ATPase subunit delta